jgi:hypothetical protein
VPILVQILRLSRLLQKTVVDLKHIRNLRWGGVFVAISVLIILSCSSQKETTVSPTALLAVALTATPKVGEIETATTVPNSSTTPLSTEATADPTSIPVDTSSVEPSPGRETPVPTETAIPPAETIDPAVFRVKTCLLSTHESGFGTAPAPTATAIPEIRDVDNELLDAFSFDALTISEHLVRWSGEFHNAWGQLDTLGEQATALIVFQTRISTLCAAASKLSPPSSFGAIGFGLVDAIRTRNNWVLLAIENLKCCGTAKSYELTFGQNQTHAYVVSSSRQLDSALVGKPRVDRNSVYKDLQLSLSHPAKWLVTRSASSIQLLAPSDFHESGQVGLGPDDWRLGTSMKISRFGKRTGESAEEIFDRFKAVPSSRGIVQSIVDETVFDQPGRNWQIAAEGDWKVEISIVVTTNYFFLIERGCPTSHLDACTKFNEILRDSQFLGD